MDLSEKLLLGFFAIVSGYMVFEAREFRDEAAMFPRAFAVLTLVGVGIIAVRSFLVTTENWPGTKEETDNTSSISSTPDEETQEPELDADELSQRMLLIIVSLTFGYILLGYLVGLIWATPFFLVGYAVAYDMSKKEFGVIFIAALAIVFLFIQFTTLRLMDGVLI